MRAFISQIYTPFPQSTICNCRLWVAKTHNTIINQILLAIRNCGLRVDRLTRKKCSRIPHCGMRDEKLANNKLKGPAIRNAGCGLWVAGRTHFGKNSLFCNSLKIHKKCINMKNLANSNHRNYDKHFGDPKMA